MNDTGKKVGYLNGLLEGMNAQEDSVSAKLFRGIVDLLGDLSDRADAFDELLDDLNDYVESIDDDLSALEEGEPAEGRFPFADDDDDDFDDDLVGTEDQLHLLHTDSADPDVEEALAGSLCSECSRMFFIGLDDPEDAQYVCPHCGKTVRAVPLTPENAPIAKPIG